MAPEHVRRHGATVPTDTAARNRPGGISAQNDTRSASRHNDAKTAGTRPEARTLSVISQEEFRRLLRQIERETPVVLDAPPGHTMPPSSPAIVHNRTGRSRHSCGRPTPDAARGAQQNLAASVALPRA